MQVATTKGANGSHHHAAGGADVQGRESRGGGLLAVQTVLLEQAVEVSTVDLGLARSGRDVLLVLGQQLLEVAFLEV